MNKHRFCGLIVLCFLILTSSWCLGAQKIRLHPIKNRDSRAIRSLSFSERQLKARLGLSDKENLTLLRKIKGRSGHKHRRYRQLFHGVPVWGHHILVTEDASKRFVRLQGTLVKDISDDIDTAFPSISFTAQEALEHLKQRHVRHRAIAEESWRFKNEASKKMVYIDGSGRARLCYLVSYFADSWAGGNPSRPTIIMDAVTGKIIEEFDALTDAAGFGPGGNGKTGVYDYGQDFPFFEVSQSAMECSMNSGNVMTWDMNHSNSEPLIHSFVCYENTYKPINGAYCPLNDAHYFGNLIHDLYVEWLGSPPLPFPIVLGVHYGNSFENAFWNGTEAVFGDGAYYFYPLVGLNVIAHEIAHGFTEQHSNLVYNGESAAINEAFSDMAGEAAEYYHKGSNDFLIGHDVWKGPGAFRYMEDPPKDGWSIDSVHDYFDGLPPHYSAGVYNKAFYTLATMPGWNTKMAFEVFADANRYYWEPLTDFANGAQGACDAAAGLGYSVQAVKDAFAAVDIFIGTTAIPYADFTYETDGLNVRFFDASACNECAIESRQWDFGDGSRTTGQNPVHLYASAGTYTVTLTVTDNNGQSDQVAKNVAVIGSSASEPPEAAFDFSAEGRTVTFIDRSMASQSSIVSWHWDFGDGSRSNEQNPVHVYAAAGSYTITLTIRDETGQTDFVSEVLYISRNMDEYCACAGQVFRHQWIANVEIGGFSRTSQANGYSDFTSDVIAVRTATQLPVALAYAPKTMPYFKFWRIWADFNRDGDFEDPGEMLFQACGTGNAVGTITIPAAAATGRTRLRVTLDLNRYPHPCGSPRFGEVEDYTLEISNAAPGPTGPEAALEYAADGLTVTFMDQSRAGDSDIEAWQWDFGDGSGSVLQNPVHRYAAAGSYTVSLTVTDANGQSDGITEVLTLSNETEDYCDSAGRVYRYQWIDEVAVAGFARSSSASGYSDFTSDVIAVTKETPLQVTFAYGPADKPYVKFWRMWADFNRDGDFEDPGEMLFQANGTGNAVGAITIPATAPTGQTRLRVTLDLNRYPHPCGSPRFGEVEDYTLEISNTP